MNLDLCSQEITQAGTTVEMFSSVCRICLQDGDLISMYEKSEGAELSYSEKIMQVTYINLVSSPSLRKLINEIN